MALINNLCSWLKRYLFRFIGMDLDNLQSYLNWFVYLFRVKGNTDKWPKLERIMRHLVLNTDTYVRKYEASSGSVGRNESLIWQQGRDI